MTRKPPSRYRLVPLFTQPEERILCAILADHTTSAAIAQRLGMSPGTIKVQLSRMYGKIGGHNMADLILWAWRHGYTLGESPPEENG
jgi:DNA-binding CsgD family transcriptional regulator